MLVSLTLPRGSVSHHSAVCEPPTGFGEDGVGSGGAAAAVLSNEMSQQIC